MKASSVLLALCLGACGADSSEGPELFTSKMALQEELTATITVTDDCEEGGTYQVDALIDKEDESPIKLDLDLTFTYTACVSKKLGTVNGTVTYAKDVNELAVDSYQTQVSYVSNLSFTGTGTGSCVANVAVDNTSDDMNYDVELAKVCNHPEMKVLEKLEKGCKFKKPKPGKKHKDKCEFPF